MFDAEREEVNEVQRLIREGLNDCEISRRTGICRRTICGWRHGRGAANERRRRDRRRALCAVCRGVPEDVPARQYAYLLGLYLGDGCISKAARTYKLRVFCDATYPGIIRSGARAMEAICPSKHAWVGRHGHGRCRVITMHWNHWPCLFPQHGPGKKHDRRIALADWQEALVSREREGFIRGLIFSDGCRVTASDRGVRSVRYHFSNKSEDIKRLYCESLDALGIPWTRPCDRQIAVYRKAAVRKLDVFVGPKR
jgi:hypothetical protein